MGNKRKLNIGLFGIMICIFSLNQCTVFNKDNRRLTNLLDDAIQPESTTTEVLLAPVAIPVGFASIVTDMVVIHPLVSIPTALEDTYEVVWEDPSGGVIQQVFLLVPKVVFTPLMFGASFLYHALIGW